MAMTPAQLAALNLGALAGVVTYRMLADQLKAAIALAQASGLAPISVALPTGITLSYPSLNVAMLALAEMERMAGEEAGGLATAKMRLA
jgi:hypothetical protein